MSRDHCWLCAQYRKEERRLELKELRRDQASLPGLGT